MMLQIRTLSYQPPTSLSTLVWRWPSSCSSWSSSSSSDYSDARGLHTLDTVSHQQVTPALLTRRLSPTHLTSPVVLNTRVVMNTVDTATTTQTTVSNQPRPPSSNQLSSLSSDLCQNISTSSP